MNPAALVKGPATINVDLPPAALASPAAGVGSALSKRLLRWCPDLGGVLLSYGDVQIACSDGYRSRSQGSGKREGEGSSSNGNSAEISDYFGFICVAAAVADALVFAPSPGMRLEGTVARVGGDYVGVLALGVFSAAVGGAALSSRFELEEVAVEVEEEGATEGGVEGGGEEETKRKTSKTSKTVLKKAWVCKTDKSHRIIEGARVLFDVARVRRSDGDFVSILGSLESPSAGVVGARGVAAATSTSTAAAAASSKGASVAAAAAKKSKSTAAVPPPPASSSKRKKAEEEKKKAKKESKSKKAKKK